MSSTIGLGSARFLLRTCTETLGPSVPVSLCTCALARLDTVLCPGWCAGPGSGDLASLRTSVVSQILVSEHLALDLGNAPRVQDCPYNVSNKAAVSKSTDSCHDYVETPTQSL